ncbi:hypothetical protein PFICI_14857 [Pestalotiopsis fici W106-1]|uniref:Uncharacterized protein n=1 Tax=Pestalotiopsis fici (strain W106-1 / CGMCC3.15140) TaxID=1229662 RepID=W3WJE9_PESFW|nr:uncharacterized protein PFICI_14857 [Pestalotiopsis fici W106-1]ETS73252.1 hypothetical protein PFICI_14857 [Pestalotiopsis fici W106-1]
MDHLRSNVPDYYTPQQYTPIPLPSYPPPTFGAPTPYAGHHLHQSQTQHHPPIQYNPTRHGGQPPLVAQTPVPIPTPAPAPVSQQSNQAGSHSLDTSGHDETPLVGETSAVGGPKGFGRTSAVYQVDGNGKKRRVNAEDFRAQVEERTRNGESCEQIADALIAQGAQVTSKSVGRWRILWGFRKRAVRKQSKPPKPKEERISSKQIWQSRSKSDITRMTQQGLSSEEIAQIMTRRGMALKKGSSTIARLQTIWQLRGTEESRLKNRRYLSRRKARRLQLEEFQSYAKELGLENPDEWVKNKMDEPAIQQMRRDAAYELMGDDAPKPKEPKSKLPTRRRTRKSGNPPAGGQDAFAAHPDVANGNDADSSDNDDDEITADISLAPRTLRSGRVSGNNTFVMSGNESESSDQDAEYQPMDGVTTLEDVDNEIMDNGQHGYAPLFEQDDDDDEEDEASEEEPTAPAPVEASMNFTNATMVPVLPDDAERESMDRLINSADGYIAAAQLLKDLLQAKSLGQPAPRSLTGLPPSLSDIEAARHRLKEAAQATVGLL